MKILFLVKFFQPFDRGGSEWSTGDLAKLLQQSGNEVLILTPNYGSKSFEAIDKVKIYRMPFPVKLSNPKSKIAPFWTNNILWFLYSTIYTIYFCIKNNIDLLHIHSNEYIIAGAVTKVILGKPTVVTFRDYQSLCALGFCLWTNNRACNFFEYIKNDFTFYWENYVEKKNQLTKLIIFTAILRAALMQKIIYIFTKKIDYKVAVSKKVAEIFKSNGIKDIKVINNPVIVKNKLYTKPSSEILYVGKFSKGKGMEIIIAMLKELTTHLPDANFTFIGSGYLEDKLKKEVKRSHISNKVKLEGQLNHADVLKRISRVGLVLVPSVWQEPLPRSVIEALESGSPVVATNVGGIPEIILNGKYGILAKPAKEDLKKAIVEAYSKKGLYKRNIIKDIEKIKERFSSVVLNNYVNLYVKALK